MQIAMAYIGVILIWSTTPLAMKWSTQDVGFLFGLTCRMGIGAAIALLYCCLLEKKIPLDHKALKTYAASGVSTYLAMILAYWGCQHIPSGWVSVIYGLSPIITSLVASRYLNERSAGLVKISGLILGLTGLWFIFRQSLITGADESYAIAAVVAGMVCYSLGIVAVKHIGAAISPVAILTGTSVVALSLLLVTWFSGGYQAPAIIPLRAAGAILYLGIVGSVLASLLFFHVLQRIEATRAALITLITPGNALLLGHLLNDEPLTRDIVFGTVLVILGLLVFQYDRNLGLARLKLFYKSQWDKLAAAYKTGAG